MTTQSEILEVEVAHLLKAANKRAKEMGAYKKSMRGPQANQVGALGELVAMEYLGSNQIPYEEVFGYSHDVLYGEGKNTMEFKTKERTVAPRDFYECTVPAYNRSVQKPDFYLFVSLLASDNTKKTIDRFTRGYILGTIDKDTFNKKATFLKKGQIDPSNGWVVRTDCYNIPITELTPPLA